MTSLVSEGVRNSVPDHLETALLPWESEDQFRSYYADYQRRFVPIGADQIELVDQMVWISWKRRRLQLAERAAHMAAASTRV